MYFVIFVVVRIKLKIHFYHQNCIFLFILYVYMFQSFSRYLLHSLSGCGMWAIMYTVHVHDGLKSFLRARAKKPKKHKTQKQLIVDDIAFLHQNENSDIHNNHCCCYFKCDDHECDSDVQATRLRNKEHIRIHNNISHTNFNIKFKFKYASETRCPWWRL